MAVKYYSISVHQVSLPREVCSLFVSLWLLNFIKHKIFLGVDVARCLLLFLLQTEWIVSENVLVSDYAIKDSWLLTTIMRRGYFNDLWLESAYNMTRDIVVETG